MEVSSTFSELPRLTQSALEKTSLEIGSINPCEDSRSWSIKPMDLQLKPNEIIDDVEIWAKKAACLYFFDVTSHVADATLIKNCFIKAKEEYGGCFAFSRVNKSDGSCLYVGSSHSLGNRLKEHLGFGNKATYSLQLKHWAPKDVSYTFVAAKYDEVKEGLLQVLEDTLWNSKKPMFGRLGSK